MGLYEDDKPNADKDKYFDEQARKAIQVALFQSHGKSAEEIRFAIRRNYPFGPLRKGRAYKIWNRLALQAERDLGLPERKHKK